jgi:hypothetical protein
MGPLMLVNWHMVNLRFRALMWSIAIVLALVIVFNIAPRPKTPHPHPRATPTLVGGLRGRP